MSTLLSDETIEDIRRAMVVAVNDVPNMRAELTAKYGDVWDTQDLQRDFAVQGFCAPYVVVRRRSDNVRGTLVFQHDPRFYFRFEAD